MMSLTAVVEAPVSTAKGKFHFMCNVDTLIDYMTI